MAFVNNFLKNPFNNFNGLGLNAELKSRIKSEADSRELKSKSDKDEVKDEAKKVDSKQKAANVDSTSLVESLQNNLANKLLGVISNFGLQNSQNLNFSQNTKDNPNLQDALKNATSIAAASSIEIKESFTYTLSFDSKSGEYTQSIKYSTSFVATFNTEIVDKNGNKAQVQNSIALGENFEHSITRGEAESSKKLKELLEGQLFKAEFDGDLNELGDLEKSGLSGGLYFIESIGDSIKNALMAQNETKDSFNALQNAINSSLEAIVGTNYNVESSKIEYSRLSLQMANNIVGEWDARRLNASFLNFNYSSLSLTNLKLEA